MGYHITIVMLLLVTITLCTGVDGTTNHIAIAGPSISATTSVPTTTPQSDNGITETTSASNTSSSMSVGAITGVVIAVLLLLVVLIVLAVFIFLRCGKILKAINTQTDTLPSPTIPKDYHSKINTTPNSSYSFTISTAASRVNPCPSTPNETDAPVYDEIPAKPDLLDGDYSYAYAHISKGSRISGSDGSVGGAASSDRSDDTNNDSTPDQPTETEQSLVVYI